MEVYEIKSQLQNSQPILAYKFVSWIEIDCQVWHAGVDINSTSFYSGEK